MLRRRRCCRGGEMLVMDGQGGGHEPLPIGGDSVEASSGNLGDQSVAAELGDPAAGVGAAAFGFGAVSGRAGMQAVLEVFVAEPVDGVLAGQAGPIEGEVLPGDGVEPGGGASPGW